MSNKKRKISFTDRPAAPTLSVLSLSTPSNIALKKYVSRNSDEKKEYVESEPRGLDSKDSMISLRDLTNMLCPKVRYSIKHYGYDFSGGHIHDLTRGRIHEDSVGPPATSINDTNYIRMNMNDFGDYPSGWADTIAWAAGTQAWYESISLPGTWTIPTNLVVEDENRSMPSLEGLLNTASNGLTHMNSSNLTNVLGNSSQDFMLHYNGGSQTHLFINQNEGTCYYELWELVPREMDYDWFYEKNSNQFSRNIAGLVTYSHIHRSNFASTQTTASGITDPPDYTDPVANHTGTTGAGFTNADGQKILQKNDIGFRINNTNYELYSKFRVSKSVKGTIEPGGILKYKMKHGPKKVLKSTYMRYITGTRSGADYDPTGETFGTSYKAAHLVPAFTKLFCIRFYSEVGQFNNATEPATDRYSFQAVSHIHGRILHMQYDNHAIRVIPYVKQDQNITKDFTVVHGTIPGFGWRIVNDETNLNISMGDNQSNT